MADEAIAKYLSDNIGGALSKALAEMTVAQPSDGIDFLARWFEVYIKQENAKGTSEGDEASLAEARKKAALRLEEKATKKAAKEEAAAKRDQAFRSALEKFGDAETNFDSKCWVELLTAASALTGAKAAYLGLVDEEGLENEPGPLIRYTETLAGSEMMKEKILPSGKGVTWGAVTENPGEEVLHLFKPPQAEAPEVDPEDPDAAAPEVPPLPYLPVNVPHVTDVNEMHYFEMTRLGAYLAVPLVYTSYYNLDALAAAKTYEEEKKAMELKRAEAQATYDAAVEEAQASGGDEAVAAVEKPPELEEQEEKPLELPGKPVKMVLCMDTLGENTEIQESSIELAMELCKVFGKCKEDTEKRLVDAQALEAIDEEARQKLVEEITAARTRADEETQENQQTEAAEAEDESNKALNEKKWNFLRAARVLLEMKEPFAALSKWVVAPPEMMNLIAAASFMFGLKKEDIYPKGKASIDWETLAPRLSEDFITLVQEADVTGERKGLQPEQKLTSIKATLAELDSEKATAISPALELLHAALDAAVAYRIADLTVKKEMYERQKEEAAESEEPVTLPLWEEVDDDVDAL